MRESEALSLEITGGTLHITASDDGINGAGGADASSLGGRPGQNSFGSGTASLRIAGGYIVVDASGDGIDVNGSLSIEGGTVLVTGPDNDGNGAFDYDGSAVVSGGVVVCVGSSGMAQGFSDISAQPSAMVTLSTRSAARGNGCAHRCRRQCSCRLCTGARLADGGHKRTGHDRRRNLHLVYRRRPVRGQ